MQIKSVLEVLQDTHSLVKAAANLTSAVVYSSWQTTASSCGAGSAAAITYSPEDGALGRDDVSISYHPSFFSYAGCRCISGYDNVYSFDDRGITANTFHGLFVCIRAALSAHVWAAPD